MDRFELLSKTVLETLRRFSAEKRPLTQESLCCALYANGDLSNLFGETETADSAAEEASESLLPRKKPAKVWLRAGKCLQNGAPGSYFFKVQKIILGIVEELARIPTGEDLPDRSDLQRQIRSTASLEDLTAAGEWIVNAVRILVNGAVDQANYAGEFLTGLSKDLTRMERELFSYQNQNRETFLLQDQFCDNLLTQTEEMNKAVDSQKGFEDARKFDCLQADHDREGHRNEAEGGRSQAEGRRYADRRTSDERARL